MKKDVVGILIFGINMLTFTSYLGVFVLKDYPLLMISCLGLLLGIPMLYGEVMDNKQKESQTSC